MSEELPPGWIETPLADVCEPVSQRGPSRERETFRYVDLSALDNKAKRIAQANAVPVCDAPSRAKQVIAKSDVLFSTVRVYLENIAQVPEELDGEIASTAFCVLRPRKGLDPKYLYYFVTSRRFIQAVNELQRGNSPPSVQDGDVRGQRIPLAPPGEQHRIASRIEELFSEIEEGERALERVQKLVERYRQSVLKAAVTGELTREWREKHKGPLESGEALLQRILKARREAWEKAELAKMKANGRKAEGAGWKAKYVEPLPPNATELPQLPERWVWARAEQLCDFITKGTTPAASDMQAGAGDVPYIKVYNLTFDGSLDFDKDPTFIATETHRVLLARSRVLPGDVVMNIVGPPLGKVSVVPESFPEWNMNQAVCVFRPYAGIENQFFASYLLSRAAQDWYAKRSKATVGQVNLTLEVCRDTPVPIPPQTEQREIVELLNLELSRIAALAHSLQRDRSEATALRQSVLSAAFSGKLVAQDTTDEPASDLLSRVEELRAAEQELTRVRSGRSKTKPLAQVMKEQGLQPQSKRRTRISRGV